MRGYMRIFNELDENEKLAFAKAAAKHFARSPNHRSFSLSDIVPGCYIALRWGLMDRSVLVLKLDDAMDPVIYPEIIHANPTET